MARVGLVRFAEVAYVVARAVVPPYRAPRSKHTFTQPQLLAVLCLMRYDDWTFRDAELRLAEHRELRRALGLRRVPDYTTLWRFFARLDDAVLERMLGEVARRFGPPPRGPGGRRPAGSVLAADATGLATGSVSTYFVRREADFRGRPRERAYWLKWVALADLTRGLILAQAAHRGPRPASRALPALLSRGAALAGAPVAWVLADAEFDGEANHAVIRALGARSAIPATRGPAGRPPRAPHRWRMATAFPRRAYRRRALIEAIFSAVKRTQGGVAPGRSEPTQVRQALLTGVSFDLARLRRAA